MNQFRFDLPNIPLLCLSSGYSREAASRACAGSNAKKLTQRMAEAGVNIEVLYSDHEYQLVLVVDDFSKARVVSERWTRERSYPSTSLPTEKTS